MINAKIKLLARGNNVPQWKIADYLGISEITLSRKLRKNLSKEDESIIKKAIETISKEAEGNGTN